MMSASWGSSSLLPIGRVHDGGTVAAASEKEHSKELETEWQQERHVIQHRNHRMQQHGALEMKLQSLSARISKLLGPAGSNRVVTGTGDSGRRSLAFLEMEISFLAVFLTALKSNLQHFDGNWWTWVVGHCENFLDLAKDPVRLIEPSCHTLLLRATECFRHRSSIRYTYVTMVKNRYTFAKIPFRYPHLLLTSSDIGLTPQQAKAGALPLVGVGRLAKEILSWLTHQGKMAMSLRVMSIVGPVGIGKTTLAVELHNRVIRHRDSSSGRCYFHCNVFAQASRGADRNILLLQDILSQVSAAGAAALSFDTSSQANAMEVLVRLVSHCLRDKRYLIIIDDIRQESDWEEIKGAFPYRSNGSIILITTRVTSIGEACCSGSFYGLVHQMKPLSEMDSERLLLAKAVGSADDCLPNNLKLLCDEILRRCNGVPLFLTAMADWLKEQRLQQQQQRQGEDKDDEHQRFANYCEEQRPCLPEQLEQALSSVFNDLPFPYCDLRSLSLYMSMFRYGYKFDKDHLISKWLKEGHLFCSLYSIEDYWDKSKTTSIAETFFSELVERNVITCVASKCKHMKDEAEACQWQVNHFMQQFLISKSAEMDFVFTTSTLNLLASASPTTGHDNASRSRIPQRLALHHPDPLLPSLLESMDLSQTRSLAVSGAVSGIPLEKFVNLVVLDFEGWENLTDEDLLQVCRSKMFYLGYLSVRNTRVHKLPHEIKELCSLTTLNISYTQITELPHEIKELCLETLDISYTQISELPLEFYKLPCLSHLDLRGTRISHLPKQIGDLRSYLVCMLVGGEGTINSVETVMSHDVCRLTSLQTLAIVDLTQHPASFIKALINLGELRVIAITWSSHMSTDRDYCEALLSSIRNWEKLHSLTIHCGLGCSMEFLSSLEKSRAPRRLEKFKVAAGRFASVPPWIQGLESLTFVQITVCNKQTTMDDLKILGSLLELRCLILGLDFIPVQAIEIENEGFSKLQKFSVDCPMPWLTFGTGALQKLTYLGLTFCTIPMRQNCCIPSGIRNLRRLTEVALCYNTQYLNSPSIKMTVDAVTKQVAEHCNPINLFINGIKQDDVQEADDEVTEITIGTSSRKNNAGAEDDSQADGEEATAAVRCEITEAKS